MQWPQYAIKAIPGLDRQSAGRTAQEVCREHGISKAAYYQWKSKYDGMEAADQTAQEVGGREPTP
jgi:hypothetical protein